MPPLPPLFKWVIAVVAVTHLNKGGGGGNQTALNRFSGSIAFIASLAHDGHMNNVSRLLHNAVDRFLDETPFKVPE